MDVKLMMMMMMMMMKNLRKQKNHCRSMNTGRNDICYVDVTFSFKVKREDHESRNSQNEFLDLKT